MKRPGSVLKICVVCCLHMVPQVTNTQGTCRPREVLRVWHGSLADQGGGVGSAAQGGSGDRLGTDTCYEEQASLGKHCPVGAHCEQP